jgi:hypothetical protein
VASEEKVMPKAKGRMVSVAIGIQNAEGLDALPGAYNGALAFYQWARALKYQSHLLTDAKSEVTIETLNHKLTDILAGRGRIERLVVYFAGHGLIRGAGETLWLLSDWSRKARAVGVELFRNRLYRYDVQQISIFADACRSLPANISAAELAPDPVLDPGESPRIEKRVDRFTATQDGTETYMVYGAKPSDARCIFSGVLMEGLWGMRPKAFSKVRTDKVTSQSLGDFLEDEVPERAKFYGYELKPTISPTFPEGADVYLERRPVAPPQFGDWPQAAHDAAGLGGKGDAPGTALEIERSQRLLNSLRTSAPQRGIGSDQCGFAIEGALPGAAWTRDQRHVEILGNQVLLSPVLAAAGYATTSPLLVEFEDGAFAATVGLLGFSATMVRDEQGVSAIVYHPAEGSRSPSTEMAEMALAFMEYRGLRADAVIELASQLRRYKHVDPVLGVISAYLYDSIGDRDSIRQIAYFYAEKHQSIPYDVAMLAMLQVQGVAFDNNYVAKVPAVPKRKPRTRAERELEWTYASTPEIWGVVAGVWPWMRQGWELLEDAKSDLLIDRPELVGLRQYLTRSRFATLRYEGAARLIAGLGLVRWQAERANPESALNANA